MNTPLSISCTTGYRLWRWHLIYGKFYIQSWVQNSYWRPGIPIEEAKKITVDNRVGIYAVKDIPTLLDLSYHRSYIDLIGRVALWGNIIEYEKGYRAQYAYPISYDYVVCVFCRELIDLKINNEGVLFVHMTVDPFRYYITCSRKCFDCYYNQSECSNISISVENKIEWLVRKGNCNDLFDIMRSTYFI